MLTLRRSSERGHLNFGWLDTFHTFSFGEYRDPAQMGFRTLRVINEDKVAPGQGFPTHFHRDMEILTLMLEGELAHKDSMGNGSTIGVGELQYMSAGRGVEHSEFNPSQNAISHLLQIWILPEARGVPPRYNQIRFDRDKAKGNWLSLASRDGGSHSVAIRQDANLLLGSLTDKALEFIPQPGRGQWAHIISGDVRLAGHQLGAGDAVAIEYESKLSFTGTQGSEILLFDLA